MNQDAKAILAKHISYVKPVHDRKVTWLTEHRPSVAFAICIGAGPWRIGRRRKVQQSFIDALGINDLSSTKALKKLVKASQLDWQEVWFRKIHRNLKPISNRMIDRGLNLGYFDNMFENPDEDFLVQERFERLIEMPVYRAPKVVQLFVRDYLFIPCFPVDRHVRLWLKERKLPTISRKVVGLFEQLGKNPSGYSRAIFNAKAENATFTPTRNVYT